MTLKERIRLDGALYVERLALLFSERALEKLPDSAGRDLHAFLADARDCLRTAVDALEEAAR